VTSRTRLAGLLLIRHHQVAASTPTPYRSMISATQDDAKEKRGSEDLLDRSRPVTELDCRGCVKRFNEHAEALFGSDLIVRHGRIRATDRPSDARLQGLIGAAVSSASGRSSRAEPVVIARNGSPWLLASAYAPNCNNLPHIPQCSRAIFELKLKAKGGKRSAQKLRPAFVAPGSVAPRHKKGRLGPPWCYQWLTIPITSQLRPKPTARVGITRYNYSPVSKRFGEGRDPVT
jgi:hypothetical protein